MVFRSLFLAFIALSLTACNITGSGQKGPFKAGSNVTVSQLDSRANPVANQSVSAQTWRNQGNYSANKIHWKGWTSLQINGTYFDEFSNSMSASPITMDAITFKDNLVDTANIHLYSHLAAARIKQHVANGKNIKQAWRTTQTEMKQRFGLIKVSKNIHRGVEQLSLTRGSGLFAKDNASLLLFTGAFLASGGDAAALQLLTDDFADDGQFNGNGAALFNNIATTAATSGLLTRLSQNLKSHGAYNPPNKGDMPKLPSWVNDDGEIEDTKAPVITIGSDSVSLVVGTAFDDDVSATDNVDGNITANIVLGGDTVDINTIGSYEITYNISDIAGNPALEVTRTVNITPIPDTTPPIISVGSTDIKIIQGTPFVDDVSASDNIDGDITSKIIISGDTVNTNTVGVYNLIYNVSDVAENAATTVKRKVTVELSVDTTAPVITLNDPQQDTTTEVKGTYRDAGATASDNRDTNVTVTVDLSNVDTSVLDGHFDVIYTAQDSAENTATATRTVTVVDTIPPVITVVGGNITILEEVAYADAGVTTTDNSGLAVTVTTDIPTNISAVGVHTITYTATDTKENSATATRTVTVQEAEASLVVSGLITLADGTAIDSALVKIYKDGVLQADGVTSNNQGEYSITTLESNSSYVLSVEHEGYAAQAQTVETKSFTKLSRNIILVKEGTVIVFDPGTTFTAKGKLGASVEIQSGAFDSNNSSIELVITPLDTSTESGLSALPGSSNVLLTGETTLSQTSMLGMAEFTFVDTETGKLANLKDGAKATITIPLFHLTSADGTPYEKGETMPLIYLDETTGIWKQDNNATALVIESESSPTGLAAQAEVGHFTWWAANNYNPPIAYANISVIHGGTLDGYAVIKGESDADIITISDVATIPLGHSEIVTFAAFGKTCFRAEFILLGTVIATPEQCITPVAGETYDVSFSYNTDAFDIDTEIGLNAILGNIATQKYLIPYTSETVVSYTITAGSLPDGISLTKTNDHSAVIKGTPTQSGNFTAEITAIDFDGNTKLISVTYDVVDSTVSPVFLIGDGPNNMPNTFNGFETGYQHHCGFGCVDVNASGFNNFTLDLASLNVGATATSWEIVDPTWHDNTDALGEVWAENTAGRKVFLPALAEGITINNSGVLSVNRPASITSRSYHLRVWAKNSNSPATLPEAALLDQQRPDVLHVFITFDHAARQYKDYWTY